MEGAKRRIKVRNRREEKGRKGRKGRKMRGEKEKWS